MTLKKKLAIQSEVLSTSPVIHLVENFLTTSECKSYISYANSSTSTSTMDQSEPPAVCIDRSKLTPLIPLALLSGFPTAFHEIEKSHDLLEAIIAALPIIMGVSFSMICLIYFTVSILNLNASGRRTSQVMPLNDEKDLPVIRDLMEKITKLTRHPWKNFEAPAITRYKPGEVFSVHNDASPDGGKDQGNFGGQRVVTVIIYLNTCKEGGETRFDKLGIKVRPKQGSALLFFPADLRTLIADDRTTHESLPVPENGEKWIIQMFGRVNRVHSPLGISDLLCMQDF